MLPLQNKLSSRWEAQTREAIALCGALRRWQVARALCMKDRGPGSRKLATWFRRGQVPAALAHCHALPVRPLACSDARPSRG